jgi:hypothetical protein
MENQAPPTPTVEPVATPTVETPTPTPQPTNYESGGFVQKLADFKIVEYFTFALIIVASVYSIYYHKQALNKLSEEN